MRSDAAGCSPAWVTGRAISRFIGTHCGRLVTERAGWSGKENGPAPPGQRNWPGCGAAPQRDANRGGLIPEAIPRTGYQEDHQDVVGRRGIEPRTLRLKGGNSATELAAPNVIRHAGAVSGACRTAGRTTAHRTGRPAGRTGRRRGGGSGRARPGSHTDGCRPGWCRPSTDGRCGTHRAAGRSGRSGPAWNRLEHVSGETASVGLAAAAARGWVARSGYGGSGRSRAVPPWVQGLVAVHSSRNRAASPPRYSASRRVTFHDGHRFPLSVSAIVVWLTSPISAAIRRVLGWPART